jgi:hypothetical protein
MKHMSIVVYQLAAWVVILAFGPLALRNLLSGILYVMDSNFPLQVVILPALALVVTSITLFVINRYDKKHAAIRSGSLGS